MSSEMLLSQKKKLQMKNFYFIFYFHMKNYFVSAYTLAAPLHTLPSISN